MAFLVVVTEAEFYGDLLGPGCDGSAIELEGDPVDPELQARNSVVRAVPCADTRAVAAAIRESDSRPNHEWTVLRAGPDGVFKVQAVRLKMDGKAVYDVELA